MESVERLSRDLAKSSDELGVREVRYLVDTYYQVQEFRITTSNQLRAADEAEEPHALITWAATQFLTMEGQIKRSMDRWTSSLPEGQWAKSIVGIGPVIAAGLISNIDITKADTVGHIWSFAGLNPTAVWGKGEKRPWNASLKVLCWKAGQSFVRQKAREGNLYAEVYQERKDYETKKNEKGDYTDQCEATLKRTPNHAQRAFYEKNLLPPGRIDSRAKRYAVKLFLAHLHHVMYETHYEEPPPKPYILTQPNHSHFIPPPNWP